MKSAKQVLNGWRGGRVLVVAPHPDDECLTGLLPLRLQEERGARVEVWAATYGSDEGRRAERRKELEAACGMLGWGVLGEGTEGATAEGVAEWLRGAWETEAWGAPMIVCPHCRDGHPRHRAAHRLAVAGVDLSGVAAWFAETDYWMPMAKPNLLVEASEGHLARLVEALRRHRGEVSRSDYDRRLGAWMCDNVRRSGEFMAGAGGTPPRIGYGTPYGLRERRGGRWRRLPGGVWRVGEA
ncbi:MAG: PIG-L family deacetylase [Kiritimatiellae bacterium]|nr:PIG-L family deacetylase [Kiritimatiellia bacterium]